MEQLPVFLGVRDVVNWGTELPIPSINAMKLILDLLMIIMILIYVSHNS
jgi:hypothetical protein